MRTKLILIICLLGQKAFSQVTPLETVTESRVTNVSILPPNSFTLVNSYTHIDLNKNKYKGDWGVTDLDRVIPFVEKYSYPKFMEGQLIYASGNQSQVLKMNYHKLYGEMQFIDQDGDTLFIANDSISYVRFANCLYHYLPEMGYVKILSGGHQLMLGQQEKLNWMDLPKTSNYNVPYEHIAISNRKFHFLITPSKDSWIANKAGFIKAFPNHKQQIKIYLQQMARQGMAIQFHKEEDLIQLLNFCTSLPQQHT